MWHPKIALSEKIQGKLNHLRVQVSILTEGLLTSIKVFNNWGDVVLFKLGLLKNLNLRLRDGRKVIIEGRSEYAKKFPPLLCEGKALREKSHIKFGRYKVRVGNAEFSYSNKEEYLTVLMQINEVFLDKAYAWLSVRNKNVIDIGANIGDTAIYFALNGAKKVYSLEPYPYSFNILQKNLKANALTGKVTAINAGIGEKDGLIKIKQTYRNYGGDDLKHFRNGKKIPIMCLKSLLNTYEIDDAVLKMDCEGGEYSSILTSTRETLRKFSQIQMEYHYGYILLEKHLKECGFRVRHTLPNHIYNQQASDSDMYLGFIYAERI
jgi:FkbM family methyltransferase